MPITLFTNLQQSGGTRYYYIGCIDILGATQMIEEGRVEDLLRTLRWLQRQIAHATRYYNDVSRNHEEDNFDDGGWEPSFNSISYTMFQDTVFLFAEPGWFNPLLSFGTLTNVLSYILTRALTAGVPIRGAITAGDVCMDESTSSLFGRGVLQAVECERKQEWAGIAFCDNLDHLLGIPQRVLERYRLPYTSKYAHFSYLEPQVVAWPVPIKGPGKTFRLKWAIPPWNVDPDRLNSILSDTQNPEVQTKIKNTVAFVNAIRMPFLSL